MKRFINCSLIFAVIALVVFCTSCAEKKTEKVKAEKSGVVVFDTDMGIDDAAALMLFLKRSEIKPDYIIATPGSTSGECAPKNAVLLKKYFNNIFPAVIKGKTDGEAKESDGYFGSDGLGNTSEAIKASLGVTDEKLDDFMTFKELNKKLSEAESITYISVGTLDNLEYFLTDETVKSRIKKVYLMGGGIKEFNSEHSSEYNFSKNPAAVSEILKSGLDITLFPLDLTNHQSLDTKDVEKLEKLKTYPEYIKMFKFYQESEKKFEGRFEAVLHDCMPVLYFMYPEKFTVEDMKITADEYGAIKKSNSGYNVHVALKADKNLLKDEVFAAFESGAGK